MWASSVLISNPVGQVVINTLKNYPLCHLYLTKEGKNSIFASDRLSSGRFGYLPKSGYRLQKKIMSTFVLFLKSGGLTSLIMAPPPRGYNPLPDPG